MSCRMASASCAVDVSGDPTQGRAVEDLRDDGGDVGTGDLDAKAQGLRLGRQDHAVASRRAVGEHSCTEDEMVEAAGAERGNGNKRRTSENKSGGNGGQFVRHVPPFKALRAVMTHWSLRPKAAI